MRILSLKTRSPIPTAVSGYNKGKGGGREYKVFERLRTYAGGVGRGKGWGGEKRAFKIPTECATLKQLIVVIVPFRGTRKLRVQLARLAR